jgi:hypothetical protein
MRAPARPVPVRPFPSRQAERALGERHRCPGHDRSHDCHRGCVRHSRPHLCARKQHQLRLPDVRERDDRADRGQSAGCDREWARPTNGHDVRARRRALRIELGLRPAARRSPTAPARSCGSLSRTDHPLADGLLRRRPPCQRRRRERVE